MDKVLSDFDSLSEDEIEEKLQDLLDHIQKVLMDEESDYEARLNCVRFSAEKLADLVPVYEAEDSLFFPLLNGVLEFIKQVFSSVKNHKSEKRLMLLSIASALVQHTDTLLRHAAKFEGLGPSEIPSIPRIIPKIVHSAFDFCQEELNQSGSDDSLSLLYSRAKSLLGTFLSTIEEMTMRPQLDDELTLLIDLLDDLAAFHQVLYTIDLKMCMCVWNLYSKLARDHYENMRYSLKVGETLIILQKEAIQAFSLLQSLFQDEINKISKKLNRSLISLNFLLRMIHSIAEMYKNSMKSEFDILVRLLTILYSKAEAFDIEDTLKEKLDKDLFMKHPPEVLLTLVPDLSLLANFLSLSKASPQTAMGHVHITLELLDAESPIDDSDKVKMLNNMMEGLWMLEGENCRPDIFDGVQVPGSAVHKVSFYEWILTKVCRFISIIQPEDFASLEQMLFHHIFFNENTFTVQLVADIMCFIGRYGSSELCYSILETICQVHCSASHQLPYNLVLPTLIGRLFNFLGDEEKRNWIARFPPSDAGNLCLWSCVKIENMKEKFSDSLGTVNECLDSAFKDGQESDDVIGLLTTVLDCHTNIFQATGDNQGSIEICQDIWRKLSDYLYAPKSSYCVAQFLRSLCDLSCSLAPKLATNQLLDIITWQNTVLKSANSGDGDPRLLSGLLLSLLRLIPNLPWISNIENIDPCLVTQIGALSSICLRNAIREPVLKTAGLQYLKNLAQASNNSGLIRLCSDENDIMDHFTLFLKEDESTWQVMDEKLVFASECPSLLNILVSVSDTPSLPDTDKEPELKRKHSPSSGRIRTKRSKSNLSIGESVDDVVRSLEDLLSRLEADKGNTNEILTQEQQESLKSCGERLISLF